MIPHIPDSNDWCAVRGVIVIVAPPLPQLLACLYTDSYFLGYFPIIFSHLESYFAIFEICVDGQMDQQTDQQMDQ